MFFIRDKRKSFSIYALLRFLFPTAEITVESEPKLSPDEIAKIVEDLKSLLSWKKPRTVKIYSNAIALDLGDITVDFAESILGGWKISLYPKYLFLPETIRVPTATIEKHLKFTELAKSLLSPYSTSNITNAFNVLQETLKRIAHLNIPVDLYNFIENDIFTRSDEVPQIIESEKLRKTLRTEKNIVFSNIDVDNPILWSLGKIVEKLGVEKGIGIVIPECEFVDVAYPEDWVRIQFHPTTKTIILSPRHLYLAGLDQQNYEISMNKVERQDMINYVEVYIPRDITREESRELLRRLEEIEKKLFGTETHKISKKVKKELENLTNR